MSLMFLNTPNYDLNFKDCEYIKVSLPIDRCSVPFLGQQRDKDMGMWPF